ATSTAAGGDRRPAPAVQWREEGSMRFLVLVLAAGAGCSNGGHALCLPLSQVVGKAGAEIMITKGCDQSLAGTTLLVPPDALATNVTVTVAHGMDLATMGTVSVGPSVRFTPDGLAFAQPATLTLPWRPADQPGRTVLALAMESGQGRSTLSGAQISV